MSVKSRDVCFWYSSHLTLGLGGGSKRIEVALPTDCGQREVCDAAGLIWKLSTLVCEVRTLHCFIYIYIYKNNKYKAALTPCFHKAQTYMFFLEWRFKLLTEAE